MQLFKKWAIAGLLLHSYHATCDVTAALQSLQSQLKTLRLSIRLPVGQIVNNFYDSPFWKTVGPSSKKTQFSYFFHGKRYSQIYQLEKDVSPLGLVVGDIFYIDMAHGDHVEIFSPQYDESGILRIVSKTVIDLEAKEYMEGIIPILGKPRSLFGQAFRKDAAPKKVVYPFKIKNIPIEWESTSLNYRSPKAAMTEQNSLLRANRPFNANKCHFNSSDLFYVDKNDGVIYKVTWGKKNRELIDAVLYKCDPALNMGFQG